MFVRLSEALMIIYDYDLLFSRTNQNEWIIIVLIEIKKPWINNFTWFSNFVKIFINNSILALKDIFISFI